MVDARLLREQSQELAEKMAETEKAAHAAAGGPFNLGSPKQLQEILYERLQLPVLGKTQKGQPSTAEDVLEQLAENHELPRLILELPRPHEAEVDVHRQAADRDRPHARSASTPRYHQAVAATGPAVVVRPEPAEHPDSHGRGPPHPPGLHRAAGLQAARRRLFADRAADHGAPVRRRKACSRAFASEQDIHRATAAEVFGASARRR